MKVKNAIMVHTQRKRVTTNAGYTMSFEPGVEKFVPGLVVGQALKYGATIVRELSDSMNVPRSADPVKVQEIVSSTASDNSQETVSTQQVAEEYVDSKSDSDDATEVVDAVQQLGSFTPKETRIKDAIFKLLSEDDPEKFVATTGRPKINALSTILGGEHLTSEVRDIVWAKMEAAGLFDKE